MARLSEKKDKKEIYEKIREIEKEVMSYEKEKNRVYSSYKDQLDKIRNDLKDVKTKIGAATLATLAAVTGMVGYGFYKDYTSKPVIKDLRINPENGHVHAEIEDYTQIFNDKITDVDIEIYGDDMVVDWFSVKPIDGEFNSTKEIIDGKIPGYYSTFIPGKEYNLTITAKDLMGHKTTKSISFVPNFTREYFKSIIEYHPYIEYLKNSVDAGNTDIKEIGFTVKNKKGDVLYSKRDVVNSDRVSKFYDVYLDEVVAEKILQNKGFVSTEYAEKISEKIAPLGEDIIIETEIVKSDGKKEKRTGKMKLSEDFVFAAEVRDGNKTSDVVYFNWFDVEKYGDLKTNTYLVENGNKDLINAEIDYALNKNEDITKYGDTYIIPKEDLTPETVRVYKNFISNFENIENATVDSLDDVGNLVDKIEFDLGVTEKDKYYSVKEGEVVIENGDKNATAKVYIVNFGDDAKDASTIMNNIDENVLRAYLDTSKDDYVKRVNESVNTSYIDTVSKNDIVFEPIYESGKKCYGSKSFSIANNHPNYYTVYMPKIGDKYLCEIMDLKPRRLDGSEKNYEVLFVFDPESKEPSIKYESDKKLIDILYDAMDYGSVDIYEIPDKKAAVIISYDPFVEYPGIKYKGDKIYAGDKDEVKKYGGGGGGTVEETGSSGSTNQNPPSGGDNGSGGSGLD